MKRVFYFIFFVVTMSLFTSCKPGVPSGIMSPGKMEDILYDYHLSQAAADNGDFNNANYNKRLYFYALLKKYDLTEAEFDKSMEYYERHADMLREIYDGLNKRLQAEAGESAKEENSGKLVHLSANGDTAIVWRGSSQFLLSQAPFNKITFYIKADSTYHVGDSFDLSFDTQFIFEDGMRDAIAMLAVRYDNDSVASQNMHISSATHSRVSVMPDDKHKIKEIRGFIFLSKGGDSKTTLKLMCVDNIVLLRYHKTKKTAAQQAPGTNPGMSKPTGPNSMPPTGAPGNVPPSGAPSNVPPPASAPNVPPSGGPVSTSPTSAPNNKSNGR